MNYDRNLAVKYALEWAFGRNPDYYNYDLLGGDCTNFISQCLFNGSKEMNYRLKGWYYKNANLRSASWTGVQYLYDFLINNEYEGPKGEVVPMDDLQIGDLIQLSFDGRIFAHTLIVTSIENKQIKICAHTIDSKNRLLNSYNYKNARCIRIY